MQAQEGPERSFQCVCKCRKSQDRQCVVCASIGRPREESAWYVQMQEGPGKSVQEMCYLKNGSNDLQEQGLAQPAAVFHRIRPGSLISSERKLAKVSWVWQGLTQKCRVMVVVAGVLCCGAGAAGSSQGFGNARSEV